MPRKNLNILVAGGFDPKDQGALDKPMADFIAFGQCLGREIIQQGHNLITGCQTELDSIVSAAAQQQLKQMNKPDTEKQRIVSYVMQGQAPCHQVGTIIQSDVPDWDIGGLQLTPPEVVGNADVVLLLGGFYGTFRAANWARLTRKPLLPFASFGGTAKEVYKVESARFDKVYAGKIEKLEYDSVLKSLSSDWAVLATKAISLAEKVITSRSVFVIMSFAASPQYKDLYASIQRVCGAFDYNAERVDESNLFKRIIPEITRQVRQSAFVIADVTEPKANVFYELGFADGIGKEMILTAKKGTDLPFDINDVPVLFWESFADFETELKKRVEQIGKWQGRA